MRQLLKVRQRNLTVGVVALALTACAGLGCEASEDERQIAMVVDGALELFEQSGSHRLFELTTTDLKVYPGGLDRLGLIRQLRAAAKSRGPVKVHHPTADVDVDPAGQTAVATVPYVVVRPGQDLAELSAHGDSGDDWRIAAESLAPVQVLEASLIRDGEQWRIETLRLMGN